MTWIHENFGDRAEGKVTKGDKIAFVRRWFPVCFDTKENMTDCLKQLDELIAAALTEAESENRKLKENETRLMGDFQLMYSERAFQLQRVKELQSQLGEAMKEADDFEMTIRRRINKLPEGDFKNVVMDYAKRKNIWSVLRAQDEPPAEGKGTKEPKP